MPKPTVGADLFSKVVEYTIGTDLFDKEKEYDVLPKLEIAT